MERLDHGAVHQRLRPCGQIPDDFVEYDWPEADWHPQEQPDGL
ncbi:hypothetical protein NKH18_02855 [Streptomyces sp. M10(2022)]